MNGVIRAVLAIGGSTLLGTACGFLFSRVTDAWNDIVTRFAAGVMLAAACFGLFMPAMEYGGSVLLMIAGTLCGVLFLRLVSLASGRLGGGLLHSHPELMLVLAIALHKFPEGMAGGISLAGMNPAAAATMIAGISLQNLPEGVVMIPPLLNAGVRRSRAACIALATGLLNAAGVAAGVLWGSMAGGVLPFVLCFAGGAMLDVIIGGMLNEASDLRCGELITLGGFLMMICINAAFQG